MPPRDRGTWLRTVCFAMILSATGQSRTSATGAHADRTAPARGSAAMILKYDRPAKSWMTEALPIGNGRLGAMIFGGTADERIQFNENSLWTGMEVNTDDSNALG